MPELPEVETVRRSLEASGLSGNKVLNVYRSREKLRTGAHWARKLERVRTLKGCRAAGLGRRGKYLLWRFEGGPLPDTALLIHLGMTGRCDVADLASPRPAHTHLELAFDDGRCLRFVDPRRFGGLRVAGEAVLRACVPLSELGPEPLAKGFDGAALAAGAGRSTRVLRDVLLDQRVVAGVGNIYASEALFEAGLHPLVPAARLRSAAWDRLATAVVQVLARGLANRGTTLRDYRAADGAPGTNQDALWVYGRGGEPCRRCGTALRAYVHQGRSGVYCPREQTRQRVN